MTHPQPGPWPPRQRKAGVHTQWWFKPFLFGLGFLMVLTALAAQGFTSGEMTVMIYIAVPLLLILAGIVSVIHRNSRDAARNQTAPATPPPGWYPDQAGVTRWFDGQEWTDFQKPDNTP